VCALIAVRDLQSKNLILLKGALFLFLGMLAFALIVIETLSVRIAALVLIAVWAFGRFYYFMFYVIEKYVDSQYKYSGLYSFIKYMLSKRVDR
jgi:hypothetical protein